MNLNMHGLPISRIAVGILAVHGREDVKAPPDDGTDGLWRQSNASDGEKSSSG